MATKNAATTGRPSGRTVVLAFAIAIVAAVALVAVALFFRSDSGTPAATDQPVVSLDGIAQDGRILGSAGAGVTLIEYADQQCPACRLYAEHFFPTVVNEYVRPGKVKMEFRGFPFIGDDSVTAYRFLLAAAEQDKLWNLQEALYRRQGAENSGWLTEDLMRQVAAEIPGLDVDRLFVDAERSDIVNEAENAEAKASAAGIAGTPTFLVKIGGEAPYLIQVASVDQMRAALDDALSA